MWKWISFPWLGYLSHYGTLVLYLTRANSVPQVTFPPCICVSHGLMHLLAWRDMMMMMICVFPPFALPASFLQYCLEPRLVLCIFRACFTWMWNSNRFCIPMIWYTIGLKNLRTVIQSKVKLNAIMACSRFPVHYLATCKYFEIWLIHQIT